MVCTVYTVQCTYIQTPMRPINKLKSTEANFSTYFSGGFVWVSVCFLSLLFENGFLLSVKLGVEYWTAGWKQTKDEKTHTSQERHIFLPKWVDCGEKKRKEEKDDDELWILLCIDVYIEDINGQANILQQIEYISILRFPVSSSYTLASVCIRIFAYSLHHGLLHTLYASYSFFMNCVNIVCTRLSRCMKPKLDAET